jgi:hypothetical protein
MPYGKIYNIYIYIQYTVNKIGQRALVACTTRLACNGMTHTNYKPQRNYDII